MLCSAAGEKACRGLFSASGPAGNFDNLVQHRVLGRSPQIRDMNFRDTTAPFTVPNLDHRASLSCANSPAGSAFYGISVRRLVALRPASFGHRLAALPLPFASSSRYASLHYGDLPTRDLHPMSSYPCWACTLLPPDCGGRGMIFMLCQFQCPVFDQTLSRPRSR